LINFTAATGSSDEVSQIYTGDLHGNLWKLDFDLASDGSGGQALSAMTFANLTSGTSYKPLFISTDSVGKTQPITMAPTVVIGPNQGTIVVFGTGKYLESADNILTGAQTQSVYAIYDAEFSSGTLKYITGRGKLKQGSISAGLVNIDSFTWGRPATDSDNTQRAGWYIDYLSAGEKQVSDFTLFGDRVIFGSIIPPQNVNDPCVGGKSNLYALGIAGGSGSSASNGSGTLESSNVGLISQPYVVESKDASVTTSDSAGRRTKTITKKAVVVGSTGIQVSGTTQTDTITLGRLSWRQINNYQELKNKPL
jgi:type IV pilus assembly protein PilY1